jgi:CheY-like chemotaxis protein
MARAEHVLIVEDDEDLRSALTYLLQYKGRHVVEAADGQLGLAALALDQRIGLVVLDLQMPVMDGATFLEHKSRGAYAHVPVVIFSSSPAMGLARLAAVVSVIAKLDGFESLLAAIGRAERSAWPSSLAS